MTIEQRHSLNRIVEYSGKTKKNRVIDSDEVFRLLEKAGMIRFEQQLLWKFLKKTIISFASAIKS